MLIVLEDILGWELANQSHGMGTQYGLTSRPTREEVWVIREKK
jgi:hypothetical protein